MTRKLSVLCYDIQKFTEDFWIRMNEVSDDIHFEMYPIIYHPNQELTELDVVNLSQKGKYWGLENGGNVPEGFMKNLNIKLIYRILRKSEVIFLYGLNGAPALVICLLSRLMCVRVVLICQFLSPHYEIKRRYWVKFLKKLSFRNIEFFISQSDDTYFTLTDVYKVQEQQIIQSVFEGGYNLFCDKVAATDQSECNKFTSAERDVLIYSYVGNLHPFKGMSEILKMLEYIEDENLCLPIQINIAGPSAAVDGEPGSVQYYQKYLGQIGSRIKVNFLGNLSFEDLVTLYRETDVLIHPTQKDCFPKVFIEAFSFGKPVITSKAHGALGSLLKDNHNAVIFELNNPKSLYECCKLLACDDQYRATLGKNALIDVENFCDPKVEKEKMYETLTKMELT